MEVAPVVPSWDLADAQPCFPLKPAAFDVVLAEAPKAQAEGLNYLTTAGLDESELLPP